MLFYISIGGVNDLCLKQPIYSGVTEFGEKADRISRSAENKHSISVYAIFLQLFTSYNLQLFGTCDVDPRCNVE